MKKYLFSIAVAAMAIMMVGCDKGPVADNGDDTQKALAATLEVTDIADNCATIKVTVTSGTASKAKIVKAVRNSELTIDPSKDIQLIGWVEDNGVEVSLPYTETLTDVSVGNDMFTAVIVYNAEGRAEICQYKVWTPAGDIDGWSTENNPGSLGEIIW